MYQQLMPHASSHLAHYPSHNHIGHSYRLLIRLHYALEGSRDSQLGSNGQSRQNRIAIICFQNHTSNLGIHNRPAQNVDKWQRALTRCYEEEQKRQEKRTRSFTAAYSDGMAWELGASHSNDNELAWRWLYFGSYRRRMEAL
jgi:hypothetical protein